MIGCSHDQFKFRMEVLVKLSLRKIEAVLSTMEKLEWRVAEEGEVKEHQNFLKGGKSLDNWIVDPRKAASKGGTKVPHPPKLIGLICFVYSSPLCGDFGNACFGLWVEFRTLISLFQNWCNFREFQSLC